MKDFSKIHYLDNNLVSIRNIPFDSNFRILHLKGLGCSMKQKIGWYDLQLKRWYLKDKITEAHPLGWSHLIAWVEEPRPQEQVKDQMDKNSETSTCCTCSYKWITGQDGSHSCSYELLKQVKELKAVIVEIEDTVDNWHWGWDGDCDIALNISCLADKALEIGIDR